MPACVSADGGHFEQLTYGVNWVVTLNGITVKIADNWITNCSPVYIGTSNKCGKIWTKNSQPFANISNYSTVATVFY